MFWSWPDNVLSALSADLNSSKWTRAHLCRWPRVHLGWSLCHAMIPLSRHNPSVTPWSLCHAMIHLSRRDPSVTPWSIYHATYNLIEQQHVLIIKMHNRREPVAHHQCKDISNLWYNLVRKTFSPFPPFRRFLARNEVTIQTKATLYTIMKPTL